MKKFKKAIISLDIMTYKVFQKFNTFDKLQFKPSEEIWKHYPKTGAANYNGNTMFNEAPILETLLTLDYLKQNTPETKPEFWYNSSLFIYNDSLFSIRNTSEIIEIDLTDTIFISFREAWSHPFFGLLEQLLNDNNGKLAKPNKLTMINNGCLNKFFAVNELYRVREEYLGDFIFPYSVKQNEMNLFLDFVKEKLGSKIVLKYDCIQEGKGVIFKDLNRENSITESANTLKLHKNKGKEVLITPAHTIKNEYRCYFTKTKEETRIFSIKERVNETNIDVYSKENIQIYKNISAKWHEVPMSSDRFQFATDIAKKILIHLTYDTGCLEFAETPEGKIIFFEVNQMAGPLPFDGEDTKNMNSYYNSMLDAMFK